jgi:hypothetical protein
MKRCNGQRGIADFFSKAVPKAKVEGVVDEDAEPVEVEVEEVVLVEESFKRRKVAYNDMAPCEIEDDESE